MLHKKSNEAYKGIQSVETFSSRQRWRMGGFRQGSVAEVHAEFRADAEEAGDEIVRFQNTLLVHLWEKVWEKNYRVIFLSSALLHS